VAELGESVTYAFSYPDVAATPELIGLGFNVEEVFGYSREEWEADPKMWRRLLHPRDAKRVIASTWLASQRAAEYQSVYRMVTRAGEVLWIEDTADINRQEGGGGEVWVGRFTLVEEPSGLHPV
jgi:PAS domain-containing protein